MSWSGDAIYLASMARKQQHVSPISGGASTRPPACSVFRFVNTSEPCGDER